LSDALVLHEQYVSSGERGAVIVAAGVDENARLAAIELKGNA
jgi:hypothetical protein